MPLLPISTSTGSIIGVGQWTPPAGHQHGPETLLPLLFSNGPFDAFDLHNLPTWDPSIVLIWAFSAANAVFNLLVVYFNMIRSRYLISVEH